MKTHHLLDPELAAVLDTLPVVPLVRETLAATREAASQVAELVKATAPPAPHIECAERRVPGSEGAPDVRVLVYRPRAAAAARPALLWIHGGGYVAAAPEFDDGRIKQLVDAVDCVVVSVDYRLAPETPFPGAIQDCYAALKWLHGQCVELGVDAARIGIAGLSAGGGLTAALGLLARDRGEIALCLQALLQPMLDDRSACASYAHPSAGESVWTQADNHFGWSALLGHEPGREGVSPYAAAARADDLSRLPPTFIAVGALDFFVEENLEYARRLMRAGVPTELHVHPGACHGMEVLAPTARVTQDYQRDFFAALRRGLRADEAAAAVAPELVAQLAALLPGIPPRDLPRFAASVGGAEPYALGPDSLPQPGVARGTLAARQCAPGRIYPGVPHDYTVYVSARVDATKPAALIVFQDGARYLGPEIEAPTVLDNLVAQGVLPPVVAVFVNPGASGPGLPIYGGSDNRSIEYDSVGDAYARFLLDELLPEATRGLHFSSDPAQRAIVGLSSGGACAFNAAWERPDAFGKVVAHCGSFVDIRGANNLAPAVRRSEPKKALRVFLQTGEHDLDIVFGRWVAANHELAAALAYRGYDHQLVVGKGGHSLRHGGAIFPDTLRWLWREDKP